MTTPVPQWRVLNTNRSYTEVGFTLPDLTEGRLTVATRNVGSLAMDEMLRQAVDRWESTRDQLREGP